MVRRMENRRKNYNAKFPYLYIIQLYAYMLNIISLYCKVLFLNLYAIFTLDKHFQVQRLLIIVHNKNYV